MFSVLIQSHLELSGSRKMVLFHFFLIAALQQFQMENFFPQE
jgi:hypothetical protein